jgi:hypothetical protein
MQILHIVLEIQHWSGGDVVVKRSDAARAQQKPESANRPKHLDNVA